MKKVSIFMAIAAAASLASCTAQAPKANLKSDIDSLSYSIGMAQTQGLKGYLTGRLDVDTAYMAEFIKGLNEGANKTSKKDIAYMAGLQIGQQISNQMMKGINQELFGTDSTKTISKENFLAGFIAGTLEKGGVMTMEAAQEYTRTAMETIKAKALEEKYADYKAENEKFLAENKTKDGVKTTASGLQYKVITEGKGEIPADTCKVKVNYKGTLIDGRYYLPADFDPAKKYPLIVYYYGGTTPVERSFGGRYPFNLFAANGYIVYVLQPSGAIGYGQEFSARHQNNWGKITADEIITATKAFIKSHSFVDATKVGCMGASYGGFTTMYLTTRTDLFTCAIAHAGISSITGYWGDGYWGYSYSTCATAHSFPWNRKDIYVDQSPLFNADKVNTPILLIHGTKDVNVPTAQSIQFYTALKLLGKEAELVFVKDSDHTVTDYHLRILWNNTILAYFAKYLKDQPAWWENIYKEKNL